MLRTWFEVGTSTLSPRESLQNAFKSKTWQVVNRNQAHKETRQHEEEPEGTTDTHRLQITDFKSDIVDGENLKQNY